MDALRRKPVVRESDVFAALFPRAFTAQSGDELPLLHGPLTTSTTTKGDINRHGATENNVHMVDTPDESTPRSRIPKLGALSPKTPRSLMTTLPMTVNDCAVVWKFLCDWITAQVGRQW